VLQATQVSYKLNELVFRILDSDPAKEAEKKDLEDMERDAARQQTNFSSFPIHELPLKLVPIAHEFRTTWADVYLFCSDVIKGGEPVDRDFKVHVLALRAQGYEQLFEIRKYTRTQHDNTERSRELEKKMQEINERLEREEEELNEEVGNSTTRTASAPRSWWPF
jgi:hypothetical protein